MKTSFLRFVLPFAALAFLAPGSALAQKGKGDGGGGSGPVVIPGGTYAETYVISEPGSYVLGGNRVMSDPGRNAIAIVAPDVTFDLGGFSISYNSGSSYSLISLPNPENVEVRNGSVMSASVGIYADKGSGLRLRDLRFVGATQAGLSVMGETLVDRCSFTDCLHGIAATGDGTVVVNECVISGGSFGIYCHGANARVTRTTVLNSSTQALILGAGGSLSDSYVAGCKGWAVWAGARSTIRNNDIIDNGTGVFSAAGNVVLIGNRLSNTTNITGTYVNGGGNVLQ